jgi:hypothetical protein
VATANPVRAFASEPTAPLTARFLAAALHDAGAGCERLYGEISRINPGKNLDVSQVTTASARLSRGMLERNRYDAAVSWPPDAADGFLESARNGAPTDRLRELLSHCPVEIAEWSARPGTTITYLGVDFDQRRYKLYLRRDRPSALSAALDLESVAAAFHGSAYIDCLELDMETAACTRSAYWKLGAVTFPEALAATYRPHPDIDSRLLRVPGRERVVSALEAIVAGQRRNEPIIKFRRPRGVWTSPDAAELAAAPYAIECSLFDPGRRKYVDDHAGEILAVATELGCRDDVGRWLDAIRPLDCYIHYVGVGEAFVTFYYCRPTLSGKEATSIARG